MKRWTLVLAVVASFGLTGCDQFFEWMYGEEDPPPMAGCTEEWDPVCGRDGMTYGNLCEAQMAHVRIAHGGPCDDMGCACDTSYRPVCDADGTRYSNPCEARCAGAWHVAPCGRDVPPPHGGSGGHGGGPGYGCACPDVWDPVCTPDGQLFGNGCEAHCAGVTDFEPCDQETPRH